MAYRRPTTRGFTRTATLLGEQIRRAGESRGFAVSRLLTHWPEVAGQDIAAIARPVSINHRRGALGATLTVLTTGAQAPMLEMMKQTLRDRVNAAYGYNAIATVRITQTAPTGFAEGQVAFGPAPVPEPARIDPDIAARAEEAAKPVQDEGLRAALARLGQNVMSRQNHR